MAAEVSNNYGLDITGLTDDEVHQANDNFADNSAFVSRTQAKIMNLGTSDEDLLSLMTSELSSPKSSDAKRLLLQRMMDMRTQLVTMLTNMFKKLSDTAQSVISNIRP